ncbi:MAG: Flp pilus assembly complex ATPase component TadA [Synergistaceae bacterium]|nr:Flp pilus assembly complex ATPase component TadA [Synergistaceae bacterium]
MGTSKKKIGEILVETRRVAPEALQRALDIQAQMPQRRLGEILIDMGSLTPRQLTEALGLQFMWPVVNVADHMTNIAAQNRVPRELMQQLNAFPLELQEHDSVLLIAISDPLDIMSQERLRMELDIPLRFALAPAQEIRDALMASQAFMAQPVAVAAGAPVPPVAAPVPAMGTAPQAPTIIPAQPSFPNATVPVDQAPPPMRDLPAAPSAIVPSLANLQTRQPRLGDVLVEANAITEADVARALQIQKATGKKLGEIFISEGIITSTRLAEALSAQLKLPLFTLTRYRPMPEAIKLVPRGVAERLGLIPLALVEDDQLLITMANPLDLLAQDEVRMLTGRNLKIGISTQEEISKNLDRLYNLQNNLEEAIVEIDPDSEDTKELDFDAGVEDAPVIQLVSNLLQQAVREGASDIHVEAYEKTARVRFRVDGQLYSAFEYPVALHPSVAARLKIMSGMDIAEKRKPQDGRILIRVDGRRIDLRASILPTMNGEKAVLRILDQESASVGLDRLGLEPDDMEKIEMFCEMPWGIMLVTGPTGSGKSTTLYSMLQRINQPDVNIITVEDPVEFSVAGINQVHVNEKAGLSFEAALRSILRQDPDKVMVGEIRDQKTAQIAIRAALTGHFVLSTLHTNDAPSAATRMIDMGVAPFLVSASLSGVIAQRLVRRLCPICREEYEIDDNTCDMLEIPKGTHAFRPRGCNECRNGYKGRRGIYEIMVVDDDLRRMILEGVSNIVLRQAAIEKGMKTLRRSALNGALAGFTSIEEVFGTTL